LSARNVLSLLLVITCHFRENKDRLDQKETWDLWDHQERQDIQAPRVNEALMVLLVNEARKEIRVFLALTLLVPQDLTDCPYPIALGNRWIRKTTRSSVHRRLFDDENETSTQNTNTLDTNLYRQKRGPLGTAMTAFATKSCPLDESHLHTLPVNLVQKLFLIISIVCKL
ncbi:hypothetical protein ANCCAN_00503, partial [Ancylostoma caninum]